MQGLNTKGGKGNGMENIMNQMKNGGIGILKQMMAFADVNMAEQFLTNIDLVKDGAELMNAAV